ncbi:hypothetical protein BC332_12598 [Capsicum chinense]|nr:hypothetical protein BC332_12598 [Capsicum chinense]
MVVSLYWSFVICIHCSVFRHPLMTMTSTMHDCYPLAVKAETTLDSQSGAEDGSAALGSTNSNITQAVFEKDKDSTMLG